MSPRNSTLITPATAPVIREMAEYSLHRLPIEQTVEDLMHTLSVYIDSEGNNTEAHIYLERSDFIQDIAKRIRSSKRSYTIKNLDTIFSYMQANNKDPVVLDKIFLLKKDPDDIIDFLDMYLLGQLKTYTDWKVLFARLEEWEHVDSKSCPTYPGYCLCIHASAGIIPQTRSLIVNISGGYGRIMQDKNNRDYICDDEFTIANQSPIFMRHIQDLKYIRRLLVYMAEETKMDIFSLFGLDPKDVQEWVDQTE